MPGQLLRAAALCAGVTVLASQAAAASYDFKTIGFPGSTMTEAVHVNNRGQVLGDYQDEGQWKTFLYDRGAYKTVPLKGSSLIAPIALNDLGEVVFWSSEPGLPWRSYVVHCGVRELWNPVVCAANDRNYAEVAFPGAAATMARAINVRGQVVGHYRTSTLGDDHGFIVSGSTFTRIDFPQDLSNQPVSQTVLLGINSFGMAVGAYGTQDPADPDSFSWHPFSYYRGKFTKLAVPSGASQVSAAGINDLGQIVLAAQNASGDSLAYVAWNGSFTKIEGQVGIVPYAINIVGQVAGCQYRADVKGFLASPRLGRN